MRPTCQGDRSGLPRPPEYIRFSAAREAVEAERHLHWTGSRPFHEPETRDRPLAAKVTRIEQEELGVWMKIASEKDDRVSESRPGC